MEIHENYFREPEVVSTWERDGAALFHSLTTTGAPLPAEYFPIGDLRVMKEGPGVYIAMKGIVGGRIARPECLYVGQALNVRSRARAGRTELQDADYLAVVRCAPHELLRIEAHYIASLNPKNNAAGEDYQRSYLSSVAEAKFQREIEQFIRRGGDFPKRVDAWR